MNEQRKPIERAVAKKELERIDAVLTRPHLLIGGLAVQQYYSARISQDIDHTKTKAKSPQTNGICERFRQTVLNEFYRIAFTKKIYSNLETLRVDLDEFLFRYNNERTHQGKRCKGRTPMTTFVEGKKIFNEKNIELLLAA